MRILLARDHREHIERRLFPGCRVLEWGSGGSTLWLADRLPPGASLTSVEHHPEWHARVAARIGSREGVRLILAEPDGPVGANATIAEEDPAPLGRYLHAADGQAYDVILVDGVARVACMDHARSLLAPGGVVYLHDAHRPWYDAGKALYLDHGTIGPGEDYPGPMLWWGALEAERPRSSAAAAPIVISFYTRGTPYEDEARTLRASCETLGLEHHICGVRPRGSWERNCAHKPRFIRETADALDRPVLWADADAVLRAAPVLLGGGEADFAVHKAHGWQFASGTVYFNRTRAARALLDRWVELCEANPGTWDQVHLDTAWEQIAARHPLRTCWLPQTYTKIFDLAPDARLRGQPPVIEHFQASRRLKSAVSEAGSTLPPRPMRWPEEDLRRARAACRVRECWYDERFVLKAEDPAPALWAEAALA
jgi:SAM-dependent methyltransferase